MFLSVCMYVEVANVNSVTLSVSHSMVMLLEGVVRSKGDSNGKYY